jgi:dolichol-phosphate mannosyltransferase
VDDASVDSTVEFIREFAKKNKEVSITIVHMSFFQGLECCMNAGMDFATGDYVYEFDSLLMDYDSTLIFEAYHHMLTGFDIVNVSSNGKQKLTSRLFYRYYNRYAETEYALNTESFRILSRRAINRVYNLKQSVSYRKAIYASSGLKMDTLVYEKINVKESCKGEDKQRRKVATEAFVLFTDIGYRISRALSMIMMLITVLVAIYAVVIFIGKTPIEGWTTTILFLAFAFFGLFSILAIVIKYLSIIVTMLNKKQNYVFESIEKI